MRRIKGYNKDGSLAGIFNAATMTGDERHKLDYRCMNEDCGSSYGWRSGCIKAGAIKVSPTFFSKGVHKQDCPYDERKIVGESNGYIDVLDDRFVMRILFKAGNDPRDKAPERHLTEAQKREDKDTAHIKPYRNLSSLVKAVENIGGLDGENARNLDIFYQGRSVAWDKLFIDKESYGRLYRRGRHNFSANGTGSSQAAFTLIKLNFEDERASPKLVRIFGQFLTPSGHARDDRIGPAIVCDHRNLKLVSQLREMLSRKAVLMIAARPFCPLKIEENRDREATVSLYITSVKQIAEVSDKYWPSTKPKHPDAGMTPSIK